MTIRSLVPFRRSRGSASPVRRGETHPWTETQERLHRMFDDVLPAPWWEPEDDWGLTPEVDVQENKKEFRVSAELPGVDEGDLDVRLDHDTLVIRGEKQEESEDRDDKGSWHVTERRYGSFVRRIPLNGTVDPEKVNAKFKNGVLTVRLPKTGDSQPSGRRIQVKQG